MSRTLHVRLGELNVGWKCRVSNQIEAGNSAGIKLSTSVSKGFIR